MKVLCFLFLLIPFSGIAQPEIKDYPRDTSFTVFSAFQKIKKEFPDARPVEPFVSDLFQQDLNRVYRNVGNRKLRMDIFYPTQKSKNPIPAVLLIHGGGWRSGNKSHMIPMAQKLAMAGYVAVAVEYRLSPEALYPAGIYDLKEAVRFLKFHSTELNIDSTKIAALGCSSGATMATFLGTTGNLQKFEEKNTAYPGVSTRINAIINIDGIVDFTDPNESGKDNDPQKPSAGALWFGGTFKDIPGKWIEASPINYVGKDTPPILFINSVLPRFHAGRDQLREKLNPFRIPSEIYTIPETPHPFWLFYPWFPITEKIVVNFLENVFN
jgi:acetyl esterase/lipase